MNTKWVTLRKDFEVHRVLMRTWIQSHYIADTNTEASETILTMQESEIFFWIFTRNIFHAQAITVNEKRSI